MTVSAPTTIGLSILPTDIRKKDARSFFENPLTIPDKAKNYINSGANGLASAFNLLTFLNSNFKVFDPIQNILEKASEVFTKCSTAAQGFVNLLVSIEKKNIVSATGAALEIPIAICASGFNLFLARGVSGGMNQFDSVMKRTKREGNQNEYYEDFKKEGWLKGFTTLTRQMQKYTKEIFKNPLQKEGLFPRSFFLSSVFMILGPLIHLSGLHKTGAFVRDSFGGLASLSLLTDKESKGLSNYFLAGVSWTFGAIFDYLKRLSFIEDKITGLTELSLCLDRIGGMFYTFGNMGENQD